MMNVLTALFVTFLLFSCVEEKNSCDDGRTNNVPDGKERLEIRLIVPVGNIMTTRGVENALLEENRIDKLFMDIMDGENVVTSCSTEDGRLILSSVSDSIYIASAMFDIGILKTGYTVCIRANDDFPKVISEQPVTPLYMSGFGFIEKNTERNFSTSLHLLRGVAKLRTAVRKTALSVPQQELKIGDVKVQVIHAVDKIRKYAPFNSHDSDEYIYESSPSSYFSYFDYPEISLTDILLKDRVELDGEMATFYSQYIYENYLEVSRDYELDKNVTLLKLTIPVTDGVISRIFERAIRVDNGDYRIKRNHIYSIDVQVLSIDEVKIYTDMLDWTDVDVTGDIVGTDFDVNRKEISLVHGIADPIKLIQVYCNTPGRFQIKVLQSNQIDLISTNDLQLYCDGISADHRVMENNGIYDVSTAQTINFYCTTGNVPANINGGFIEITADNVRKELIPVSSLINFTALDTEGTANCYIGDKGAGSYSFIATVMGNGVNGIIDEGEFEDAQGNKLTKSIGAGIHPLSAKLLWQDTDELVEQVGLDTSSNRVLIKMGRSRGNALIAVYDNIDPNAESAKVLWSWHLWCTSAPKVIEYSASRCTGNEYKVMDRNIGATTSTPNLGTTQGLTYQWGRKDPYSGSLSYDGKRTVLYDIRSVTSDMKYSLNEPVTVGQAINTPHICHMSSYDGRSWCKGNNIKYLWGNPEGSRDLFPQLTSKTIYDPCPIGYKVAPGDVFQVLAKKDFAWESTDIESHFYIKDRSSCGTTFYCDGIGKDETKVIFLPEAYIPSWAAGDLRSSGRYWSSSLFGTDLAFAFTFYWQGSYMVPNSFGVANVGSIRCVKE